MDGAVALIDALHAAGFALAVGSSAPPENVVPGRSTASRAARRVPAIVTNRDVTRGKPDPQGVPCSRPSGVRHGAARLRRDRGRAGRRPRRCGRGMANVALLGTAPREALLEAGACLTVASLDELSPDALARLIDGGR